MARPKETTPKEENTDNSGQSSKFKEILLSLPKTEIHLHLEGLVSFDSIWALWEKNKLVSGDIRTKEDLLRRFQIKTLDEFIDVFINIIQHSFRTEDDLTYLINDAGEYFKKNNIVYSEIFFAPTKFLNSGFSFPRIVEILTEGANLILNKYGVEIKYLIDVSRTFGLENAMKNLNLVLEHKSDAIIGIGLGGSEKSGPSKNYEKVFQKAREHGIHFVAHSGEDMGCKEIDETITYLNPERIGHGTSAIQNQELMNFIADYKTPLEVCPTSNLFTRKFVTNIENHPVKQFYENNIFVTINSDDPSLFSTSLVDEYMLLYKKGIFSQNEILDLIKNNIYATFLTEDKKNSLWEKCNMIYNNKL